MFYFQFYYRTSHSGIASFLLNTYIISHFFSHISLHKQRMSMKFIHIRGILLIFIFGFVWTHPVRMIKNKMKLGLEKIWHHLYSIFIWSESYLLIWMTSTKWLIKAFFSNDKKKLMYRRVKDHKKWESQVLVVVFLRRIRKCSINNDIYCQKRKTLYHIVWKLFSLFFVFGT